MNKSNNAIATWVRRVACLVTGALLAASAQAGNESWMQDNAHRFRHNDLTLLSVPASHDAGMYTHDLRLMEIGLQGLRMHVELSGHTLFHFPETSGVLEAHELLDVFDGLMAAVAAIDTPCVDIPGWGEYCSPSLGLADLVWGWVGEYYLLATGKPGELSITQNLDLYGQLYSGVRMFDLRPKVQRGRLYIHHSQANIEGIGHELDETIDIGFDIPCLGIDPVCFPGTPRHVSLGTLKIQAAGQVKSLSPTGPALATILSDVRRFLEEGHQELLVLDFSHYWKGLNGEHFGPGDYAALVEAIEQELGPWLLTDAMLPGSAGQSPAQRLVHTPLQDLLGGQGRVIATFTTDGAYTDPDQGLWEGGILSGDGSATEKPDLQVMMDAQRDEWLKSKTERFELFWTLTCPQGLESLDCEVRELAGKANPVLPEFVDSLTIPNANGNIINEIWVDFSDETAATEIAIGLTPITVPIDFKPGNDGNVVNPRLQGSVWVAVLSDPLLPLDALQLDPGSIRLGPGEAEPEKVRSQDVNRDGMADLMLRFDLPDAGLDCSTASVRLRAETFDGQSVVGIEPVRVVGCPEAGPIADQDTGETETPDPDVEGDGANGVDDLVPQQDVAPATAGMAGPLGGSGGGDDDANGVDALVPPQNVTSSAASMSSPPGAEAAGGSGGGGAAIWLALVLLPWIVRQERCRPR